MLITDESALKFVVDKKFGAVACKFSGVEVAFNQFAGVLDSSLPLFERC